MKARSWLGSAAAVAIGFGVVACVVLAAGCDESASSSVKVTMTPTPAGPTPVAWMDATMGPSPSPSPYPSANPSDLNVRACQGADLTAEMVHSAGAAGNNLAYWKFTNVSATPCRLEGVPDIRLLDSAGNQLPATTGLDPCFMESAVQCAATIAAVLAPGGAAGLATTEPNVPPTCPTTSATLVFELPYKGGDVPVQWAGDSSCAHIGVGRFQPQDLVTPTPMPHPDLSAKLLLPDSATAGATLEFTVELSNNGGEPFSFGALCPNYIIIVGPKSAGGAHALNCQPVPQIAPGASVTFSMQGDIPVEVPGGSYSVDWLLDGTTYLVHAGTASPIDKTPYTINVLAASGFVQPSP